MSVNIQRDDLLAAYAVSDAGTRGRDEVESPPRDRSEFQRDRDRIIHSAAFRRLEYKTQVFVNHEGDLYRTRLTHSLEVAQIGRSIARALALNEDLTEAICLAHDLGHTPFGHAGQDALNDVMQPFGGFEHNLQSLRVVDHLEERYAAFRGLNLCFETREGILKHCSAANARKLGAIGERFLARRQPSLEAQIANLADEIAYNNHDVDDGLRSGLLTPAKLLSAELFAAPWRRLKKRHPDLNERTLIHETVRRMIDFVVGDVITATRQRIAAAAPADVDAVRAADAALVGPSAAVAKQHLALKRFLRANLYRHYRVLRMTSKARRVVRSLFTALFADTALLPPESATAAQASSDDSGRARVVADYIAGMTDRFAISEYERLYDPRTTG